MLKFFSKNKEKENVTEEKTTVEDIQKEETKEEKKPAEENTQTKEPVVTFEPTVVTPKERNATDGNSEKETETPDNKPEEFKIPEIPQIKIVPKEEQVDVSINENPNDDSMSAEIVPDSRDMNPLSEEGTVRESVIECFNSECKVKELCRAAENKDKDGNILCFGPADHYRNRNYVIRMLMMKIASERNIVVTDPSGDMYRMFKPVLDALGYEITILDMLPGKAMVTAPWQPGFDLLGSIKYAKDPEEEAYALADIIMKTKKNDFWEAAARELLVCVLLYVAKSEGFVWSGEYRSIGVVCEIIKQIAAYRGNSPVMNLDGEKINVFEDMKETDLAKSHWRKFREQSSAVKQASCAQLMKVLEIFGGDDFKQVSTMKEEVFWKFAKGSKNIFFVRFPSSSVDFYSIVSAIFLDRMIKSTPSNTSTSFVMLDYDQIGHVPSMKIKKEGIDYVFAWSNREN